jgi:protein-L-isoaspartate O-methyltransferase
MQQATLSQREDRLTFNGQNNQQGMANGVATPASDFHYVGSELDLFAEARNWKAYWSRQVGSYITGDVLEVGAGIGSNTAIISSRSKGRWVCLEPDSALVAQLSGNLKSLGNGRKYECVCGTLESLDAAARFDTVIYIDVLEHIQDDARELNLASSRLHPGGRIIVLSPAHQSLYTPFDAAIGHFRRYNRASLRSVSPVGLQFEALFYLDACGIVASAANQVFLRQSMPTRAQIGVWDKWIVPASRVLDPIFRYSLGKSIVGIWRESSTPTGVRA